MTNERHEHVENTDRERQSRDLDANHDAEEDREEKESTTFILRQSVEDAYYLHNYSITTGKNVPVDVSKAIIECKRLCERSREHSVPPETEIKFSTAYRKLAALMLPVSVESLRDTEDVQFDPHRPLFKKLRFSRVKQITLFLPLLAISLILLILGCEIIQSIFLSGLQEITAKEQRLEQIDAELTEVEQQLVPLIKIEEQINLPSGGNTRSLSSAEFRPQQVEIMGQKDRLVAQLEEKKTRLNDRFGELNDDIRAQLENLKAIWDKLPVHPSFFRQDPSEEEWFFEPGRVVLVKTEFSIATQVLNRLLPILYGALGATAYFLRVLIPHIRHRTFTRKHSGSISVRICLGMLSGIAIQWFFTESAQQAQIFERALSTSALAFLAGYSVDLLFSIMDRFIMGFKSSSKSSTDSLNMQEES